MSGRTPSFIVVGLVIIMFLLGVFYMSCSSKNTELRLSLEQFEERYRSLTLKNSDSEKKYENLNLRKRELEEDKVNIQRQMEKKDSEINDLNTKLNEKIAELKTFQSDKKVLEEQLKDYKSLSETIAAKNTLIEKLQSELNEKKQTDEEFNRLKRDYDALKNSTAAAAAPPPPPVSNTFVIPPQRFRPLEANNYTTKSIASLFQESGDKLSNLTKEVKPRMVPVPFEANLSNTNSTTTTTVVNQQELNQNQNQQPAGQNVPAPPLANQDQKQQQQQAAPQAAEFNGVVVDNLQYQNKLQRALNNSLTDIENDDEEELNYDHGQENRNHPRQKQFVGDNVLDNPPVFERAGKRNYRIDNRDRLRYNRKRFRGQYQPQQAQQQVMDHGGEIDAHEDGEYRSIRKRSVS